MKNSRALSTLLVGLAMSVSSACSSDRAPLAPVDAAADTDSAVAATGAPNASLLGGLLEGTTGTIDGLVGTSTGSLLSCRVAETKTASQWIGSGGGMIRVGPHTLLVPPGALSSYTRITATAPKGNIVLVEFEPHGLKFQRPTALTMSYRDCGLLSGLYLDVVYINDSRTILEILPSLNNLINRTVTGRVDHFSGYALADRKGTTSDDATVSDGSF